MTTPEGRVKAHLRTRVSQYGGELVFVKYVGRVGCPDTRMRFPNGVLFGVTNAWVETKAKLARGRLSTQQEREIDRMRAMGEVVHVLTTVEAIDALMPAP